MRITGQTEFTLPALSGVHRADGSVVSFLGELGTDLHAGKVFAPAEVSAEPATLYPEFEVTVPSLGASIVGGGGAWEGEGFVALVDAKSREIRWLVYSEASEPFTSACIEQGFVFAQSGNYPRFFQWRLAVAAPEFPVVVAVDA